MKQEVIAAITTAVNAYIEDEQAARTASITRSGERSYASDSWLIKRPKAIVYSLRLNKYGVVSNEYVY